MIFDIYIYIHIYIYIFVDERFACAAYPLCFVELDVVDGSCGFASKVDGDGLDGSVWFAK